MRALLFGSMLVLLAAGFAGSPASALLETDGTTAHIAGSGAPSPLHLIFQPNAAGNYGVRVATYQEVAGVWKEVAVNATLKIATPVRQSTDVRVDDDPLHGNDPLVKVTSQTEVGFEVVYSAAFTSRVGGSQLFVPASVVKGDTLAANGIDLYVVIDGAESHHNLAKNRAIEVGQYDTADSLDGVTAGAVNAIAA